MATNATGETGREITPIALLGLGREERGRSLDSLLTSSSAVAAAGDTGQPELR